MRSDMISGGADDQELFRELLRLKNGVPSHVTVSRIFRLLDPSAFASATRLVIVRYAAAPGLRFRPGRD